MRTLFRRGGAVVAASGVVTFTDPVPYQASIRPAQVEILVTAKGDFHAELTAVELPRLWLQRGRETLPRISHSKVSAVRPPLFFLASRDQGSMRHDGVDVAFGEIVAVGSGTTHHHRTEAPCHWASMSLPSDDLAALSLDLVGRSLVLPPVTRRLRPAAALMSRLLKLHGMVGKLAADAAGVLSQREPARALEHALVHAMIACLSEGEPVKTGRGTLRRAAIIGRFEELLAANHHRPLYLAEVCAAVGVSERTLRIACMEHLGIGPIRYLWLRRMHLAHRALLRADSASATVTKIATGNGFFELGRFAVEYGALFGEAPSASLGRRPQDMRASRSGPFAFATAEYA